MASLTRIAYNSGAATLTHTFYVGETPTAPTGTPTYAIVDANGTAVASGNGTLDGTAVTAALATQALLRNLTVTWTGTVEGSSRSEEDYVEIVGGHFFSTADGRASDQALSSSTKYPTADIELRRLEVEVECEEICDRAFIPRYRRIVVDGNDTRDIVLDDFEIRTIRRVAVAPTIDGTFTDLTAAQLAALAPLEDRTLRRTDGNVWTFGNSNIIVEYEYGLNRPPADLVWAAKQRLRSRLNMPLSAVPDRAISFNVADGGTYRLSTPDAWKTGIPDVDAVYARYSLRSGAGTGQDGRGIPASRTLDYTPQRYSLFHR